VVRRGPESPFSTLPLLRLVRFWAVFLDAAERTHEAVVRRHETFGAMWRDGGRAYALRSRSWIAKHERLLRRALSAT
jgi:hypothetical protein